VYVNANWQQFDVPVMAEHEAIWIRAWLDQLEDLPAELVLRAVAALANRDHPPKPGQLRTAACQLQNQLDGVPAVPDVDEAWDAVTWAAQYVGRYQTPEWPHPAIAATVKAIGWVEICNSENLSVLRGQFARLYETCKGRVERESVPAPPALAAFMAAGLKRVDDVLAIGAGDGNG
jgi:hypothetical protein